MIDLFWGETGHFESLGALNAPGSASAPCPTLPRYGGAALDWNILQQLFNNSFYKLHNHILVLFFTARNADIAPVLPTAAAAGRAGWW